MAASSGGILPRRIAYVDGLRALAVLSVVVYHAANWNPHIAPGLGRSLLSEGAHGVDLFFVLSGFCLAYPALRSLHRDGKAVFDVAGYMARRIVRIIPPYYLAIVVIFASLWGLHAWLHVADTLTIARLSWIDLVKQALFVDRRTELLNPSFWTLAIEWRWYFLFPLVLLLWTRSARAFIFAVVWCGLVAAMTRSGGLDFPVLPPFMLGIVAADLELRMPSVGRLAALLAILAACIGWILEPQYWLRPFPQLQPGWQLAAFFFVLAAGSIPALRAALSLRLMVWIGVASYSIYLIHEPVIALLEQNTSLGPILAAVCAVAGGALFWAIFERPFMTSPLKGILVSHLQPKIAAFLSWTGIPRTMTLTRPHATVTVAPSSEPTVATAPSPQEAVR